MFVLEGKPLSPDVAFTTADGTQYPANWLRLASPEDREAVGITEEPDPPAYDQRFYWGYDEQGNLIPKQLDDEAVVDENGDPVMDAGQQPLIQKGLKSQWISQQKETAGSLLTPTDWYVTRNAETGVAIPAEVLSKRESIRSISGQRESLIAAVTSVEELVNLLNAQPEVWDFDTEGMVPNPNPFLPAWPN